MKAARKTKSSSKKSGSRKAAAGKAGVCPKCGTKLIPGQDACPKCKYSPKTAYASLKEAKEFTHPG